MYSYVELEFYIQSRTSSFWSSLQRFMYMYMYDQYLSVELTCRYTHLNRTNDHKVQLDTSCELHHTSSTLLQSSSLVSSSKCSNLQGHVQYRIYCSTLQVGHFLTRFAHASQSTECPQGLNVMTVFVSQTKHWTDASGGSKTACVRH